MLSFKSNPFRSTFRWYRLIPLFANRSDTSTIFGIFDTNIMTSSPRLSPSLQSRTQSPQALWSAADRYVAIFLHLFANRRTLSPLALWPAVGRQERLWGIGILLRRISAVKQCVTELIQSSQSKKLNFFEFSRVSPGAYPLTKKPEDSGYEIAFTLKTLFMVRKH